MSTLTILRGVSGSGKSTWARQQNAVVVSRDSLRAAMWPDVSDEDYYKADKGMLMTREQEVTLVQDATIGAALKMGRDVIVDNTNIEWKYVKALANLGYKAGADVKIKVFDVPLGRALTNAEARANAGGRLVEPHIIRKQHDRLQGTKDKTLEPPVEVKPYTGTPGKPKAFLVDIDGTLAHMHNRSPYDWKKVGDDHVDEIIADIVFNLGVDSDYTCIVMSGRDAECLDETMDWLDRHAIPWKHLYMRAEKDMRRDDIVKAELFDKYVRDNFDVKFVLDDRDQVVRMWRKMGLTCLQVAEGNF